MLVSGVRSCLLPVSQNCRRSAVSRPAVCPAGYRHQRENRTEKHPPSGAIARPFGTFPEPSEFPEGLRHASDRSRSASFCSCAGANVHICHDQIYRLPRHVDRHQPPDGQPLRVIFWCLCPFWDSHGMVPQAFWSGPRWSGWGLFLPGTQAPRPCGALLFSRVWTAA
jgi:hypothetical protein